MRVPSGDHAGWPSTLPGAEMRVGVEPIAPA